MRIRPAPDYVAFAGQVLAGKRILFVHRTAAKAADSLRRVSAEIDRQIGRGLTSEDGGEFRAEGGGGIKGRSIEFVYFDDIPEGRG